jgi:hypothetical protein
MSPYNPQRSCVEGQVFEMDETTPSLTTKRDIQDIVNEGLAASVLRLLYFDNFLIPLYSLVAYRGVNGRILC